jgi:CheY-like chemotaxis protein
VKKRVVVIDDEPEVCELIGKVLIRAGHEVLVAHNGEVGLSLLEANQLLQPIDCLVVDKLLPQMGGLEVVAAVRARWPHVAIVLVTAHPEPFNLEAERPEVVLAKPFKNLAAVEDAVREAIELHADARAETRSPLTTLKERVAAVVTQITPGRRKRP